MPPLAFFVKPPNGEQSTQFRTGGVIVIRCLLENLGFLQLSSSQTIHVHDNQGNSELQNEHHSLQTSDVMIWDFEVAVNKILHCSLCCWNNVRRPRVWDLAQNHQSHFSSNLIPVNNSCDTKYAAAGNRTL